MRKAAFALALAAWLSPAAAQQLTIEDRMKSCDAKVASAAAREVLANPEQLKEPVMLFLPAIVLYRHGAREDGVFWFYAAQLRTRYQLASEQGDRGQLMMVMMMTAAGINNYAFQDIARFNRTLDRVLEWDRKTPNPHREREQTPEEREKVAAVYKGIEEMRTKLAAEKDEIERQSREAAPLMQAMMDPKSGACAPGKPDPMYDRVTIEAESRRVLEVARTHPDVLRELGAVKSASHSSSIVPAGETLPARYFVFVQNADRGVHAVFNVTRSAKEARLDLACLTPRPSWESPGKDACAQ
jgi:hypothetical protein